jgi:regulator of replication initiation timing
MQTPSALKALADKLVELRTAVAKLTAEQAILAVDADHIKNRVVELQPDIVEYLQAVTKSVESIEKGESQESILWLRGSEEGEPVKVNLYLWQLLNFIGIYCSTLPNELS